MKFKIYTTENSYSENYGIDYIEQLIKLGFKFNKEIINDRVYHNIEGPTFIEFKTLEDLIKFSKEISKIVTTQIIIHPDGELELYNARRE